MQRPAHKACSRPGRFGGMVKVEAEQTCHKGLAKGLGMEHDPVVHGLARHLAGKLHIEILDADGAERWVAGLGPKPAVLDKAVCGIAHGWGDLEVTCKELSHRLQGLVDGKTLDVAVQTSEMRRLPSIITAQRGAQLVIERAESPTLAPYVGWLLLAVNGQKVFSDEDVDTRLYDCLDDSKQPDDGVLSFQVQRSICTGAMACCTAEGYISLAVYMKPEVPDCVLAVTSRQRSTVHSLLGFPKRPILGCTTKEAGGAVLRIVAPAKKKVCKYCTQVQEQREAVVGALRAERMRAEQYRPASPLSGSSGSVITESNAAVSIQVRLGTDAAYHDLDFLAHTLRHAIARSHALHGDGCSRVLIRRVFPAPDSAAAALPASADTTTTALTVPDARPASGVRSPTRLAPLPHAAAAIKSVWAGKLGALVRAGTMRSPVFEFVALISAAVGPREREAMAAELTEASGRVLREASRGELSLAAPGGVVVAGCEGERSAALDGAIQGTSAPKTKRLGVSEYDANRTAIREEDVLKVKKVFDTVDTDGSGTLGLKELIKFSAVNPKTIPNTVFRYVGALGNDITFAQLLHSHFPKCGWHSVQNAVDLWCPRETAEAAPTLSQDTLREVEAVYAHFDKTETNYVPQADLAALLRDAELAEFACGGHGGISLADFTALVSPFFISATEMAKVDDVARARNLRTRDWSAIFPCGSAAQYLVCPYLDQQMGFSGPKGARERGGNAK
eukprot:TRINITY_DN22131_c0_g1_i1.p1 TRINITY_DN22131_c0_g1~~TRINITY_DN22131_c0_g1_i1.p1  ORF type:complete len:733 (+),score=210.94 TRINITY_DN22131_c0_g1_i1:119-2317(+)